MSGYARMSLTLRPEIATRLDSYASSSLIPKVRIINLALDSFLAEREEDLRDAELAASAYERFEKSGSHGITLEDLRKKAEL